MTAVTEMSLQTVLGVREDLMLEGGFRSRYEWLLLISGGLPPLQDAKKLMALDGFY